MSGVIIPRAERHELGLPFRWHAGVTELAIKCAACRDTIPELRLLADPAHLEEHPAFVLCEPCYIHIRTGYQRDRDRRARATYAAGEAAFSSSRRNNDG